MASRKWGHYFFLLKLTLLYYDKVLLRMIAKLQRWPVLEKILVLNFAAIVIFRLGFAFLRIILHGPKYPKMALFAESSFIFVNICLTNVVYKIDFKSVKENK